MNPIYSGMDSDPQTCHPYRDQASYPPSCHPHRDHGSQPQYVYPSWESPVNGTFRYFSPGECNGCWNHSYPPAPYNLRPPCSYPQPPQHYFHGTHPPCPNMYPTYFIPYPQYFADQGRSHCCGCPNHSFQMKDDSGLKIEEDKPGIKSRAGNISSDMVRSPGYPYPLVWLPPDHMKDDDCRASKLKANGTTDTIQWPAYPYSQFWFPPDHMKGNGHVLSEPQQHGDLDGWIPLDINSLKSLKENGERKLQNQQNGTKRTQFPLPIGWMPSCDQLKEAEKNVNDMNASAKAAGELPPKFKIIPINHLGGNDCNENSAMEGVSPGSQICLTLPDKRSTVKKIPVKQMEDSRCEKLDSSVKQGVSSIEKMGDPEKQKEEDHKKKTADSDTKKHVSPGRPSKLPPVCLRIDPLPKKKAGYGTSRSTSAPGHKEVKVIQERPEGKAGGSGGLKECKEDGAMDKEVKVVEVLERTNSKSQKDGAKNIRVVEVEDRSNGKKEEKRHQKKLDVDLIEDNSSVGGEEVEGPGKDEDISQQMENESLENLRNDEEINLGCFEDKIDDGKSTIEMSNEKKMEEKTERKRKFSESDAVLHIQSAYRGYEVRRWEPLKKLKQIAKIRDQLRNIKQQILSLEASSEQEQLDEKKQLCFGETIMNLLLQLDTIQGLHPSVREIRKCVARDLVSLQEKMDILSSRVAKGHSDGEAGNAPMVCDSKNDIEKALCNNNSFVKISSIPQKEPAKPPTVDIVDYAEADKPEVPRSEQDRSTELRLEDPAEQNSTLCKPFFPETSAEQVPSSDTGLTSSQLEKEESCGNNVECENPPTHEIGVDSMVVNMGGLPAEEEHASTIAEIPQEFQEEMQNGMLQTSGEEDSSVEVHIFVPEDKAVEPKVEFHETRAQQVEQPSVFSQPFSDAGPIMLQEEKDLQAEESVPVVEDLMNILEQDFVPSSEDSKVLQQSEDSAPGTEASSLQNGEHCPNEGGLPHEPLDSNFAEAGAAGSGDLPFSENTMPDIDNKENDERSAENIEVENFAGLKYVNPEIAATEGDAEHANVENCHALTPASIVAANLAESDNDDKPPALIVEESIPAEEEDEANLESPDIKDIDVLLDSNAIGTTPTGAGLGCEVPETEHSSVDGSKEHEGQLIEENEKLRELLEKLLEAGNKQYEIISSLSERVKDLEKKVARRRKLRMKQHRASK